MLYHTSSPFGGFSSNLTSSAHCLASIGFATTPWIAKKTYLEPEKLESMKIRTNKYLLSALADMLFISSLESRSFSNSKAVATFDTS